MASIRLQLLGGWKIRTARAHIVWRDGDPEGRAAATHARVKSNEESNQGNIYDEDTLNAGL